MLSREDIIKDVEKNKIIVILRGFNEDQLVKTVDAMAKGGIRLVEVPFDQSGKTSDQVTASHIRLLQEKFAGIVRVGAGTVLTEQQVEFAYDAGAEFIISPDCYEKVIRKTRQLGMVSMPGVFTPSEVTNAHRYGADFVKLFPNSELKVSYLKALITPLSHIKFLAVGGVNLGNLREYLDAGAKGVGVATAIADKKVIAEGDYGEITRRAKAFTDLL